MPDFPKRSPQEIIEDLRDRARESLADAQADEPGTLVKLGLALTLDDMLEWEAADCIEDLLKMLPRE